MKGNAHSPIKLCHGKDRSKIMVKCTHRHNL